MNYPQYPLLSGAQWHRSPKEVDTLKIIPIFVLKLGQFGFTKQLKVQKDNAGGTLNSDYNEGESNMGLLSLPRPTSISLNTWNFCGKVNFGPI